MKVHPLHPPQTEPLEGIGDFGLSLLPQKSRHVPLVYIFGAVALVFTLIEIVCLAASFFNAGPYAP